MIGFGKMLKSLAVSGLILCGTTNLSAFTMEERVSSIEKQAWAARDMSQNLSQPQNRQAYEAVYADFVRDSREFARQLVENNQWEKFSEFYQGLDEVGKLNFEMVVKGVMEELFRTGDYLDRDMTRAQDYFPGYGYAKPGYTYRRGTETKREFLYAYWKEEVIEEAASLVKELTIEISLLAKFKLEFPKLEVLEALNIEIEGKIYECVKIKIEQSKKITTKQTRKFGYEKAWFELFEAKKKWFGDLEWKLVGQTFQHDHTPTGESVVTSANL
ncbi:MAG: hypothetical protein H3C47_15770 [Candidatus Cloacimonetes bacterium]|nr:hypothetical protein [Candidatus Cloacimonadota bacterium]